MNKIDSLKHAIETLRLYRKKRTVPNSGLDQALETAIRCMEEDLIHEEKKA